MLVFLLKPFGFHLTMDTLSSGCLATESRLSCFLLAVSAVSSFVPVWSSSYPLSPASEALPPLLDVAPVTRVPEGLQPS